MPMVEKTKESYVIKSKNGTIISKLNYYNYQIEKFDWILIANLETSKSYRRKGFASRILNELYSDTPKNKGLYLFVKTNNYKAINLYNKQGFKAIKKYYLKDGYYLIMTKSKDNSDITQFDNMIFT